MKYNLPKGHLSFSQIYSYLEDPHAYFRQVVLGEDFKEKIKAEDPARWDKIRLGSIFQDAWADPSVNWRRKLKKDNFTADKERIIATALDQPHMIYLPKSKCEKRFTFVHKDVKVVFIVDGLDGDTLIENKFGNPWNQEKADETLQISIYNLGIKTLTGKKPKRNVLQSFSDKSGKGKLIETKRTMDDLKYAGEIIVKVAQAIHNDVWEK